METITLDTHTRNELLDITEKVQAIVKDSGVSAGLCHLWCTHTTAGLTVNENTDPAVKSDLLLALNRIVFNDWPFEHLEGNSPAHVKSSLIGCDLSIPIVKGRLILGTWQGVFFAEFDGPRRNRQIAVTIINSGG